LQGGETARNAAVVESSLPALRQVFDNRVEVLLNLGIMDRDRYRRLRDLGATSYILKHETSDPRLHEALRHEGLERRLRAITDLLGLGYRVGTGLISGLPGQSFDSVVEDIELAGRLGVHMCSVSPFVPAPDTPLAVSRPGSLDLALNIVACLRIAHPTLLIPSVSAFEQAAHGGQSRGLAAGANVMTVNFSAEADRGRYLIYGRHRYVVRLAHVRRLVEAAGLQVGGSVFLDDMRRTDAAPPRGGRR